MFTMARLTDQQKEALRDGGFMWNPASRLWIGHGLSVASARIAHLELFQVDQLITAAKHGETTICVYGKEYKFA